MRTQPVDPLAPRWDLGVIPCTSGKNPDGVTPTTLYKGTLFANMMKHAVQRCDHVLIMSAKFGLLRLDDPVSYYDAYLPDLSPQMRERLKVRVRAQLAEGIPQTLSKPWDQRRVISYLPKAYHAFLLEASPAVAQRMRRPFEGMGMFRLVNCLSAEVACYGKSPSCR